MRAGFGRRSRGEFGEDGGIFNAKRKEDEYSGLAGFHGAASLRAFPFNNP